MTRVMLRLLLAFTCSAICLLSSRLWLDNQGYTAMLYYDRTAAPTFGQVMQYMGSEAIQGNKDVVLITAWAQEGSDQLESEGHSVVADLLYVGGDAAPLLPQQLIAGHMPAYGSLSVALDENTAYQLFGSIHVVGKPLYLEGNFYEISGVFEAPKGILSWGTEPGNGLAVLPAPPDMKLRAIGMRLRPSLAETISHVTALSAPLGSPAAIEDRALEAFFIRQLGWLPLWLCALSAALTLLKGLWRRILRPRSGRPPEAAARRPLREAGRRGLAAVGGLAAAWAVLRLVQFAPAFPLTWLPTRWSDFDHWGKLAAELSRQWAVLSALPAMRPELPRRTMLTLLLLSGALALILRVPRQWEPKLQHLIGAALLPAPALLLAWQLGLGPEYIPALVFFPAIWTGMQMAGNWLNRE